VNLYKTLANEKELPNKNEYKLLPKQQSKTLRAEGTFVYSIFNCVRN